MPNISIVNRCLNNIFMRLRYDAEVKMSPANFPNLVVSVLCKNQRQQYRSTITLHMARTKTE